MSVILADVAGGGSGKTTRSVQMGRRKEFRNMNHAVVDPEKEYVLETDFEQINPKADIVTILEQKWLVNTFLIIDCGGYYFSTKNIKEERKLKIKAALGGARHRGNFIYINFHSLIELPSYIRIHLDLMTLGHTNDSSDIIRGYGYKDDKLKEVYHWLREPVRCKEKKPHACDTF